jgi:hypothetical protein
MGRPAGSKNKVSRETKHDEELSFDERMRSVERVIPKEKTARGTEPKTARPSSNDELISRYAEIRRKISIGRPVHDIFTWQLKHWGYSWDHFAEMVNHAKTIPWEILNPDAAKDFEKDIAWMENYRDLLIEKEQYEFADRIDERLNKIKGRFVGKGSNIQIATIGGLDLNALTDDQLKKKIELVSKEITGTTYGNATGSVGSEEPTQPTLDTPST